MNVQTGYRIVRGQRGDSWTHALDSLGVTQQLSGPGLDQRQLLATAERAIGEAGRVIIEGLLEASADQVAGPRHQGKRGAGPPGAEAITRHGRQPGVVRLGDRSLRVRKPRLRRRGDGPDESAREVPIPAYQALRQDPMAGSRMMELLLDGLSTRRYGKVLSEMAGTVGVSASSLSRRFVKFAEQQLKDLQERRFEHLDILIIYLDGIVVSSHHVLMALGVDATGSKHLLGMRLGASENAEVAGALLEDLVARGLKAAQRRLFVIDGSKSLRAAIDRVFGKDNPVQRCRVHKIRNVVGHLPQTLGRQVAMVMRAAWKLEAGEGMRRIRQQAEWLRTEHPCAAHSMLEGLEEMFTVNRLGLTGTLRRCLCSTNTIESPNGTVRRLTGKVSNWRDGSMVFRWSAVAYLRAETRWNRIAGHAKLWMLRAALEEPLEDRTVVHSRRVG